jgi:hypothetical protein
VQKKVWRAQIGFDARREAPAIRSDAGVHESSIDAERFVHDRA